LFGSFINKINEILASKETVPSSPPPPLPPPLPLPPLLLLSSSLSSDYELELKLKPLLAIYVRSLLYLLTQRSIAFTKSRDIYDVPLSESKDGGDKGPYLGRLG
jgi:hypothetical protein